MIGYFDGMLKCEARDQLHKIMLNVTPLGSLKPSYIKTMSYIHKIRTACAAGDNRVCIVPVVPVTSLDIFTSEGVKPPWYSIYICPSNYNSMVCYAHDFFASRIRN
jgi:hypothetical protein